MCSVKKALLGVLGGPVALGIDAVGHSMAVKNRAARKAANAAVEGAQQQAAANTRAYNKANAKQPNILGFMAANRLMNSGGQGSTMLTGVNGAGTIPLARTSLLGS